MHLLFHFVLCRPCQTLAQTLLGPCFHLDLEGVNLRRLFAIAQQKKVIVHIER